MDPIKEAFGRAKQDIAELRAQLAEVLKELDDVKRTLNSSGRQTNQQTDNPTYNSFQQTIQQINPTDNSYNSQNQPLYTSKTPISKVSSGNRGVPTDRQTNQQTDRQTTDRSFYTENSPLEEVRKVSELLNSLDNIKKDIRLKFKKLTNQEMLVFSTIYQLEEQGFLVDYPLLSQKLNLSESSMRDYTQRMIKKGIPLQKAKENNKKVILSVSKDLKKLASLSTISQLREI